MAHLSLYHRGEVEMFFVAKPLPRHYRFYVKIQNQHLMLVTGFFQKRMFTIALANNFGSTLNLTAPKLSRSGAQTIMFQT